MKLMSALGQKQTLHLQILMSALPPKAGRCTALTELARRAIFDPYVCPCLYCRLELLCPAGPLGRDC